MEDFQNQSFVDDNEITNLGDDDMEMSEPTVDNEDVNDPKKDIQRLAGELSQALRMYNLDQETPDTDLNKYVVGMIATQAVKDMTGKEKQEIVKKIDNGEDIDDSNEETVEESKQNSVMDDEVNTKRFEKKAFDFKKNPFSSRR